MLASVLSMNNDPLLSNAEMPLDSHLFLNYVKSCICFAISVLKIMPTILFLNILISSFEKFSRKLNLGFNMMLIDSAA